MAKVYAIISGKGGVGKTTSAINLATSLNHLGEDVVVVDANLSTPNIGIHLGAPIVPVTLNHVLMGHSKIEDAIYEHESGTKIMPASLSLKDTERIDPRKLIEVTRKLKKITNHVILDGAAGLNEEAQNAIHASDEIIIVTNPEMAAVTDALKTIKLTEELNKPILGVIITRYQGKRIEMSIANIKDMLEFPILGIIPEDDAIKESQVMKNSVIYTHPKSKAARTYLNVTRRMLGREEEIDPVRMGFIEFLIKRIGLK
jgi:septum site-determining protein MinD